MAEEKNYRVNVDFSKDTELFDDLQKMVVTEDTDVSKFIRKLVREERARRQQLPLPFPSTTEKKSAKRTAEPVAA